MTVVVTVKCFSLEINIWEENNFSLLLIEINSSIYMLRRLELDICAF